MNTRKVCLFCLLVLFVSTTAHARIVFSSERKGVPSIYVMDDDGNNQTLLVGGLYPIPESWSPDGTQILFKRYMQNGVVLYLMNPGGTNIRQLTENDGSYIGKCSFSPDGKYIVYDIVRTINNRQRINVEVLNIKTGKREVISDMDATFCDWSPDGKHIVFTESLRPGRDGTVWIMEADGDNPRRLIPVANGAVQVQRWSPRWSPDGTQIAFYQEEFVMQNIAGRGNVRINKASKLMVCDRNGTNIQQLNIPTDLLYTSLDWMDDGDSIVFSAQVGIPIDEPIPLDFEFPPGNIYKYHIKTEKITQLTNHPGWDQTLDWISDDVLPVSPQGKKKVTWGKLKQ